jgi:aquaporin NIP
MLDKHYLSELFGTFLLVFIGTGSCVISDTYNGIIQNFGIAVVFGVSVWLLVQILGRFSDCHINPAVTICFLVKKDIPLQKALVYTIFQFVGALLASLLLHFLFPTNLNLGNTLPSGTWQEAFVYEFFLSFTLILVILVSTSTKAFSRLAPFLIGFTVFLAAWWVGPICGASMNPARSFGPAVVSGNVSFLWLYVVAPIAGMLFGLGIFNSVKKYFK